MPKATSAQISRLIVTATVHAAHAALTESTRGRPARRPAGRVAGGLCGRARRGGSTVRSTDLADALAAGEINHVPWPGDGGGQDSRAKLVESIVVGTVVFEAALVALRRLAQEHHAVLRWGAAERDQPRAHA